MVESMAERRGEVLDVLVEAFWGYPAMSYMLGDEGRHDDAKLRTLIGMFIDSRVGRGSPVLGVGRSGSVVAAALVDTPDGPPLPQPFAARLDDSRRELGDQIWDRIVAFGEASKGIEPEYPHHYIGMVGVRDSYRGHGFGRQLIDAVVAMADADESSSGVCLSTELEKNLGFYEHLGFEILGEVVVGGLRSWTLMRPCRSEK